MAKVGGGGSIVQLERDKTRARCRRWQLRVNCGMDPRTGKYRVRTHRFSGTYTEAQRALREFAGEVERDRVQPRTSYDVERWCERYIRHRELNHEISPVTASRMRCDARAACRHIGRAPLASVTPAMLDDMYVAMLQGDTLSGRPSSGTRVQKVHSTLRLAFAAAVREGVLVENPCDRANPPRRDTRERAAVDQDRVKGMLAELDPTEDCDCAFMLAVCMGLRRGEICGLVWGDVDFGAMTLGVERAVDAFGNVKEPKTVAGRRLLPLPENVASALRALRDAQRERVAALARERERSGRGGEAPAEVGDDSPVITTSSATRPMPHTISEWWAGARDSFGLAGVTFHELRHSYLTMLAMNGVHPRVMQELAGHADPAITMSVYTHVNLDAKRKATDVLAKALAS